MGRQMGVAGPQGAPRRWREGGPGADGRASQRGRSSRRATWNTPVLVRVPSLCCPATDHLLLSQWGASQEGFQLPL